jgi:hypothetical protein
MNHKQKTSTRLAIACLVGALAFPALASATYQAGDSPTAIRHENGPAVAVSQPVASPPSAVREVRVVNVGGGSTTLPTVFASVALAIALTGTTYVAYRLRSVPRRTS